MGQVVSETVLLSENEEALIPAGYVLGYEEIRLQTEDNRNQTVLKFLKRTEASSASDALSVETEETDQSVILNGQNFVYVYDKRTGLFSSIRHEGRAYLDRPMELNIWRAPTDNDMYVKQEWKRGAV